MCCCLLYSNPNQYMQEDTFENNKGMVNSNLNTPSMWCILIWKLPLYGTIVDYNFVCVNVIYVAF
jgi:hypothetical protein